MYEHYVMPVSNAIYIHMYTSADLFIKKITQTVALTIMYLKLVISYVPM